MRNIRLAVQAIQALQVRLGVSEDRFGFFAYTHGNVTRKRLT